MDLTDLREIFRAVKSFTQGKRALRLRWLNTSKQTADALDDVLLVQYIDISERLNAGISGAVTCLSVSHDLPLEAFEGAPIEVQIVTDTGELRLVRAIVQRALRGYGEGGLTLYQLHVADPLTLMLGPQRDLHAATDKSVVEVTDELLGQLQAQAPALASTFTWTWKIDRSRYPRRAFWLQKNESLASFLMRQWKRYGINWFARAHEGNDRIEIVLFDSYAMLDANPAGEVRIHNRLDATEERDSILHWAEARQLDAGRLQRLSWDYKPSALQEAEQRSAVPRSDWGRQIAEGLRDARVDIPHAGDDWSDFERLTQLRMDGHDMEAHCALGISGVAALQVGCYTPIQNLPGMGFAPEDQRRYVFTFLRHNGASNVRELNEPAAKLTQRSERIEGWAPAPDLDWHEDDAESGYRYLNAFVAVKHGTPIVPAWNEDTDLPRMEPLLAIVAGESGEPVTIDELGRAKVRIIGERTQTASAWVRVATFIAHQEAGALFPLQAGTEVKISFAHGDEARPVIDHVYYSGDNPPPRFNNGGGLPSNKHLAGIHLHEIKGRRFGELLFDLTPGQINVQFGSEHADSRLLLGSLYGKRFDGDGKPLGDGFYLRTQASGTLSTGRSMLLTAWGHTEDGKQLDSTPHQRQLQAALDAQQGLGSYAAQHHGLATDDKPQGQLLADIQAAQGGSNTDPDSPPGKPTISVTAPEGIAASTPRSIVHAAGENADTVANKNVQVTAGQNAIVNAGKSVSLFAQAEGVKIIANNGQAAVQSQNDDTRIESAKNIVLNAAKDITLMAENIYLVSKGSAVRLSDLITLMSKGQIVSKGTAFPHEGPDSMELQVPSFGTAPADQKFKLMTGEGESAIALALQHYRITMSDGSVVEGQTDAQGHTDLLQRHTLQFAKVEIINKPKA